MKCDRAGSLKQRYINQPKLDQKYTSKGLTKIYKMDRFIQVAEDHPE